MKKFKIKSGLSGNGLNYLEIGNKKYDDIGGAFKIKDVIEDILKDLKYKFFNCIIDEIHSNALRFKLEKGQWEKWFYFTSKKHWSFGQPVNFACVAALAVKFIISSYEEAHIAFQNKLNEVGEIEISINEDLQSENEPINIDPKNIDFKNDTMRVRLTEDDNAVNRHLLYDQVDEKPEV